MKLRSRASATGRLCSKSFSSPTGRRRPSAVKYLTRLSTSSVVAIEDRRQRHAPKRTLPTPPDPRRAWDSGVLGAAVPEHCRTISHSICSMSTQGLGPVDDRAMGPMSPASSISQPSSGTGASVSAESRSWQLRTNRARVSVMTLLRRATRRASQNREAKPRESPARGSIPSSPSRLRSCCRPSDGRGPSARSRPAPRGRSARRP